MHHNVITHREGRPPGSLNRQRRYSPTQLARGTDDQGRFIGPRAFERGLRFFWNVSHRRSSAPAVHSDPVFERGDRIGNHGGKGQPRGLRSGLDFLKLRQMAAMKAQGKGVVAIALAAEVSTSTAYFHLKGSASMRAALAQTAASASTA